MVVVLEVRWYDWIFNRPVFKSLAAYVYGIPDLLCLASLAVGQYWLVSPSTDL